MFKKLPKLLFLLLAFSSFSYGQILTFDFQGNLGDEVTANSDFNDIVLGVSTISRGAGLTAANNENSFNSINWSTIDIADAIANDDYIEFTIPAPAVGFSYDVTTINFDVQRTNNGLTGIVLRSSLDAYASDIDAEITLADVNTNTIQNVTINVNQVDNTDAITYRLYGYAENTNGGGRFEGLGNNIEINGSVNTFPSATCSISDNFSSATLGAEWTDVGGNSSIIDNRLSFATGGATALDYVHQDISGSYNTTLNTLTNVINWEFNMRQTRANPSGFDSVNNYGATFVIGASNSDLAQGNGYAVMLGQAGATDNVRLVRYTNGIDADANLTDIITGGTDFGNEYLSIRVTYDPATNTWELFVRDDLGNFNSPGTLDATNSQGTVVNTDYTGIALNHIAAVWNHATDNDETAIFDNICISFDKCASSTIWDGSAWSAGIPNSTTEAILNGNYTTSVTTPSFTACSLTINNGFNLTVSNGDFIEILNDVAVSNGARITTETQGSFVQRGDGVSAGVFFVGISGNSNVIKTTAVLNSDVDYTYWSSPVANITVADGLTEANTGRRFTFNASNFLDANGDGIDDDANAWTALADTDPMDPGKGYISTHGLFVFPFGTVGYDYTFEGAYNTGDITQAVPYDAANIIDHWNLLGNPYPSAIDTDLFFSTNSGVVDQVLYMWSQVNPADGANPGNEVLNFNQNDYITVNTMSTAGNGTTPAPPFRQVPSGQSFFIASIASGNVTFTNTMRVAGNNVNDEFYRSANTSVQNTDAVERLWINLSSDIGIYSQISVGYADFATDTFDGNGIDTFRNYAGNAGVLYSLDNDGNGFYVIQGKAKSSLTENEILKLGFASYISTNETYTLEAVGKEGDFLSNNTMYIKDNYLNTIHDLTSSGYTFTSDGGTFNDRFEIVFKNQVLSINDSVLNENDLIITELVDGNVRFQMKNASLSIDNISIYDLQGRRIYELNADSSSETYNLSYLKSQVFIAKVELENGVVITKKSIKK